MSKIQALFGFLMLLGLSNCQYPVDNSTLPDAKQYIVIDAELTELYGKINVAYTLNSLPTMLGC